MKREKLDYEILPQIILVNSYTNLCISPLGKHSQFGEQKYLLQVIPLNQSREPVYDYDCKWTQVDSRGNINFDYTFSKEQQYYIRLFREQDIRENEQKLEKKYDKDNAFVTLGVYVLEEDLFKLTPFKGDFHSHSHRSDGKDSPELVAANYRKNGFDFFALTDHKLYTPSLEAIDFYKDSAIDLLIVKGEEVHPKDNHVHIVNFGGDWSVNELAYSIIEKYDEQVKKILSAMEIPENMTEYNAYEYASSCWVFGKIKESGGLSIYAHPYWLADAYHVSDILGDKIYKDGNFDAFELLGGHPQLSNNIQTAYYNEMAKNGYVRPIVGSSDSHNSEAGGEWFNWTFTIVFSEELETKKIQEAVKNYCSVAVESYPEEAQRVYGSYRLVLYSHFLLTDYFPFHKDLCFEEGRLMKNLCQGKLHAKENLAGLQGRTREFWQSLKEEKNG